MKSKSTLHNREKLRELDDSVFVLVEDFEQQTDLFVGYEYLTQLKELPELIEVHELWLDHVLINQTEERLEAQLLSTS